MELFCEYMLIKDDEDNCVFKAKSRQPNILNTLNEQNDVIIKKMSEFQRCDSGWTLIEISRLDVKINQYIRFAYGCD